MASTSNPRGQLRFSEGTVRITELRDFESNRAESISFAELLDSDNITQALVSAFLVDEDWLVGHFLPDTHITLVTGNSRLEKSTSSKSESRLPATKAVSGRLTRVFPELPKPSYQIMHTKIMLLFYPNHMRFVVSTANLIPDDWTIMQNAVFVQDFPMDNKVFPANEFSMSLAYALHDLSVPYGIIALLNNVDFAKAYVRLVTSVPTGGYRQNVNMDLYGMERLAQVVRDTMGEQELPARLYCVGSSLGRIDTGWLRDFYLCAHGIDTKQIPLGERQQRAPDDIIDIGIGFHTNKEVSSCRYSGCEHYIMCNRQVYESKAFPQLLCRVVPRIENTLVHAKFVVTRFGVDQKTGWVYVGSHNFTPAAWGRLSIKGTTYLNNYELGVVLPSTTFARVATEESQVSWNRHLVPLPFKLLWQPYSRNDVPYFSSHDDNEE
ncbi:hypothetical protein GGI25_003270 [Coemansia spiralis]|uniref:Tyrosyl-DNA phosphodiesterase n=2 Tax=Coemansia TaxID=4863 RepID=A0A9W8G7G8_9FUNG|nr:tyrosyl-DNA phosphodiesterase I [Coemansia spiralis]KAJ1989982.1 hypothetical protein EDC05_004334 [Coemansia umbellata]KAJ2621497.1 hypothetical protein GGI26_004077 [Coemansia sp. RSA 1358]KAJ2677173.1 hypothetical protein GGI25_003270 [Coemansia spiralis]